MLHRGSVEIPPLRHKLEILPHTPRNLGGLPQKVFTLVLSTSEETRKNTRVSFLGTLVVPVYFVAITWYAGKIPRFGR